MTTTYEITTRDLDFVCTAVVRGELPATEMSSWLPRVYRTVFEYLQRAGVAPAGPPFARFTFLSDTIAVEAGVPVSIEVTGEGEVEPSALPDGPAAVTTHLGRYEDLTQAYDALLRWLDDRGLEPAGPHWEVYYTDPNAEPDPTRWRTDVVMPYRASGDS